MCGKILIYGSGTSTSGGAAAGAAAAAPFDGSLLAVRLPVRPSRDEGVRHLSGALARGAAPAIKEVGFDGLVLRGNPASDAAQRAVKDALKNRK